MSFGAGLAAGIGIGVAIGMSSGTRQARDRLNRYFQQQGITLEDDRGKQLALNDTLDQAFACPDPGKQKLAIALLLIGLLTAAALGVVFYFLATGN